jgi:methylthioribose-1-phosphate isomerase
MDELQAVGWKDGKVRILDQTQLPNELVLLEISDHHGIVNAIKDMNVRGAPAIGIAAAFGVVVAIWNANESDRAAFLEKANLAINDLKTTRPTAKNLFWALDQMRKVLSDNLNKPLREIKMALLSQAQRILDDDIQRCRTIGRIGADLLPTNAQVLTHCNAGALATGGYGTALGIIRAAIEMKKSVKVFATETRPLLQGARLTTFELIEDEIEVTLICDSAVGYVMKQGMVNFVIVGADRIARNGDVVNKIGTYNVAALAKRHQLPFFVAAPLSTFDFDIGNGNEIPIEKRAEDEVRKIAGSYIAPEDVPVFNPAFDITPNDLIWGIVTEKGVLRPPFIESINKLKNKT